MQVAEAGDLLKIHYVGRFDSAEGEVFDASRYTYEQEFILFTCGISANGFGLVYFEGHVKSHGSFFTNT